MPYPEGGVNGYVHQLPVRHSWGRITLRRGVIRDLALWVWYRAGLTRSLGARRDGAIVMMDENGGPAIAYAFRGGLAAKWIGPELSGSQSNVAIDALEIAHQGLEAVPFPPSSAAGFRRIADV
jgi:phage tail-like protein